MTTRVGQLPAATSIATTDFIPVEQGGVLKRATPTLLPFVQSGTGAVSRSVQSRLRDRCSVLDFGALGDGSNSDLTAFRNAFLQSTEVWVPNPSVGYVLDGKLTFPTNGMLRGAGKHSCKILHAYNGSFCELGSQAGVVDLYIEGQGATFTGKGAVMSVAGVGKQFIQRSKIVNFGSACIAFDEKTAGSQFSGFNIETFQVSAATGSGKYAITIEDASASGAAVPRKFSQIETGGSPAFSFGGASDLFISDSFLADLAFSTNSVGVHITNSRIANQSALSILGTNHTITGCGINPNVTLSGVGPYMLSGNDYNGTLTDSSSNPSTNFIETKGTAYTPVWTAASSNPDIGNGTIAGWFTRVGNTVRAAISITMGNTTTFGTGEYSFSLPFATTVSGRNQPGSFKALRNGVQYVAGACELVAGGSTVKCYTNGAATAVSPTVPVTWASPDTMTIGIDYIL